MKTLGTVAINPQWSSGRGSLRYKSGNKDATATTASAPEVTAGTRRYGSPAFS